MCSTLSFLDHDNQAKPHRSIDLDSAIPLKPVSDTSAVIERVDRLGGAIHEYRRVA